jgi:hypothetical protein
VPFAEGGMVGLATDEIDSLSRQPTIEHQERSEVGSGSLLLGTYR